MPQMNGMIPEWERQEAVMLAWPHEDTDWKPWLARIRQDYVELAVAISTEAVPLILCRDEREKAGILASLGDRCIFQPRLETVPYNDTWCRDYGPVSCRKDNKLVLMDFCFNGWGDKYDASLDNAVNRNLSRIWQAPLQTLDYELEGGSIETDGEGSLLTTVHCLMESNRNTDFDRAGVEQHVLGLLGLLRALWIGEGGLSGDDTDSHIDNLVRFCSPDTIAYLSCPDASDEHYNDLRLMAAQVQALRRADGSHYRCVPIDMPAPRLDETGKRLPASYVNFLVLNNSVLVPVFGCPEDARALDALAGCFPGRKIVPVPGGNLIRQFGGPHCATMQLPVGALKWND
jgi:agmatine deiminase